MSRFENLINERWPYGFKLCYDIVNHNQKKKNGFDFIYLPPFTIEILHFLALLANSHHFYQNHMFRLNIPYFKLDMVAHTMLQCHTIQYHGIPYHTL